MRSTANASREPVRLIGFGLRRREFRGYIVSGHQFFRALPFPFSITFQLSFHAQHAVARSLLLKQLVQFVEFFPALPGEDQLAGIGGPAGFARHAEILDGGLLQFARLFRNDLA
ncbi:MAG: hypothetical protein HONDAALG_02601 [Gammaproteobacteria bacterium]|nr:hypothetical protein [Gammaproteobacteria bacterium]